MSRYLVIALAMLTTCLAQAAVPDKSHSQWWGTITTLASDDFQGRLTGSPGYRKAAEHVAGSFQRLGLKPAGTDGYLQNIDFEVQTIDLARSTVRLRSPGNAPTVDISDSVVLAPSVLQRPEADARLVFAGYAIHLPEAGYDDFAGLDVRGAVVVYVTGGPQAVSGAQRAHNAAEVLPRFLEQSGAVGFIAITAPQNREVPWARQKAAGAQPGLLLAEKLLRRYQGPMFGGGFDETKADMLLAGSGHAFAELAGLSAAHQPLPRFRLLPQILVHTEVSMSKVSADNVVGELPGTDPALAPEAVVVSAHLDHLGTGRPDNGDGIFRGAMDDASGVATLIEVARAMQASHLRMRRSVLFLAVCGEEKGLLGSRYFAAHPSRHAGHLVADINSDMFLPLYPLTRVVGFGADESSLGADLADVAAKAAVTVVPDPKPDHLVFVRSDQYSFVRKGVPALMLQIVPRPDSAEQAIYDEWFLKRYHAQADNLDQPVNLEAADGFTRLVGALVVRVANAPQAPQWNSGSFFAKFAAHPLP